MYYFLFIISFEKWMPMNGLTKTVPLTLGIIYFDEQEQGELFFLLSLAFHFINSKGLVDVFVR